MNFAQTRKVIAAGMIGNVWYDFAIYGYFASAIGRQFFPHEGSGAVGWLAACGASQATSPVSPRGFFFTNR
jgi:MHS family proline/betaine transporter-like MFS transporter